MPAVRVAGHQVLLLQQLQHVAAPALLQVLPSLLDARRHAPQRPRRRGLPKAPPSPAESCRVPARPIPSPAPAGWLSRALLGFAGRPRLAAPRTHAAGRAFPARAGVGSRDRVRRRGGGGDGRLRPWPRHAVGVPLAA